MTKNDLIVKIAQSDISDETAKRMAAAMNPKKEYDYPTMQEYADKFRVSKRTVERLVRKGELTVERIGKSVRIKVPVE